jgi:LacI family transcriptional regulator
VALPARRPPCPGTSRERHAGLIDVVFNGLSSPLSVEILLGAEEWCSAHGVAVAVSAIRHGDAAVSHGDAAVSRGDAAVSRGDAAVSRGDAAVRQGGAAVRQGGARPANWTSVLAGHDTDGVLLVTSKVTARQVRQLRADDIPLVVIDPVNLPQPDLPSVGATNWVGGIAATDHLIECGHTRIAAIGGPEDYLCSLARIDGYRLALERAGLKYDPELVRHGDFQYEGGFLRADSLLDLTRPPTAIFAGSDEQALGVYEAARKRGLRVPQDLSVVGFDDLPTSRWSSPPLTTVRQPLGEIGWVAAEMLGALIEGLTLPSRRIEVTTELVVRASTAARARAAGPARCR